MVRLTISDLIAKLKKRCSEEFKTAGSPTLKISFKVDALWVSEEGAKVRGKDDVTEYYKFWEASEFKDFEDAEELLNNEERMGTAERIEVLYDSEKKGFDSWKEFLMWLGY